MTFSSLRQKEIIDTCSGTRLGSLCDLELSQDGRILCLIIPAPFSLSGIFKCETISIPWSEVTMMGEDVILVQLRAGMGEKNRKNKEEKQRLP